MEEYEVENSDDDVNTSNNNNDNNDDLLLLSPTTFLNQTLLGSSETTNNATITTQTTTTEHGLSPTSYLNSILLFKTGEEEEVEILHRHHNVAIENSKNDNNNNNMIPIVPSLSVKLSEEEDTNWNQNHHQEELQRNILQQLEQDQAADTNHDQQQQQQYPSINASSSSTTSPIQPETMSSSGNNVIEQPNDETEKHNNDDKNQNNTRNEEPQPSQTRLPIVEKTIQNDNNNNNHIMDLLAEDQSINDNHNKEEQHIASSPIVSTTGSQNIQQHQPNHWNDVFRSKEEEELSTSIPNDDTNNTQQNNSKSKSLLQVEFPSPLQSNVATEITTNNNNNNNNVLLQQPYNSSWQQKKGNDVVSLSSASSTISYGSTAYARGMVLLGATTSGGAPGGIGVLSPSTTTDDNSQHQQRRNTMLLETTTTTKPPRFPKKAGSTKELLLSLESPRSSFVDTLSKKLIIAQESSEGSGSEDYGSEGGVETRWIKQPRGSSSSFNPKRSIFATKNSFELFPDMSPPGSPPEPVYEYYHDGDNDDDNEEPSTTSHNFSMEGDDSSSAIFSSASNPEAATWDMISETIPPSGGMLWHGLDDHDLDGLVTKTSKLVAMPMPGSPTRNLSADATDRTTTPIVASLFTRSTRKTMTIIPNAAASRGMVKATGIASGHRAATISFPNNHQHRERTFPDEHLFSDSMSFSERPSPKESNACESSSPLASSKQHQSSPDLRRLTTDDGDTFSGDAGVQTAGIVQAEGLTNDITALTGNDSKESDTMMSDTSRKQKSARLEEESIEARRKGALLNEELVACSSFRQIDIPLRFRHPCEPLRYLAFVKWKQLASYWKHSEMVRSMTLQLREPNSFSRNQDHFESDEWSSTRGCCRKPYIKDLKLNGVSLHTSSKLQTSVKPKNFSVLQPALSRFVTEVQSSPATIKICQEVAGLDSSAPLEKLLELAGSEESTLRRIVSEMAAFAANTVPLQGKTKDGRLSRCSVCTKHPTAIERKAKRKYGGDILQVKDILRAKIVFPDDKSLICGLVRLMQMENAAEEPSAEENSSSGNSVEFRLVRIKNLFARKSLLDNELVAPLPTGYRHVLLNIQLDSGLLAEIQCNLSPLFDVLGDEGYRLHEELAEVRQACEERRKLHGNELDLCIENILAGENPDSSVWKGLSGVPLNQTSSYQPTTITPSSSYECTALDNDETPQMRNKSNKSSGSSLANGVPQAADGNETCSDGDHVDSSEKNATAALNMGMKCQFKKPFSVEDRMNHLQEIIAFPGDLSSGDVILALIEYVTRSAERNPRDISTYYCLYRLLLFLAKHGNDDVKRLLGFGAEDMLMYAQQCLIRCLKISNQAQSFGMMGWLEYGRSSPLDRIEDRPVRILSQLACDFARRGQWADAESVLSSLLIFCENSLPSHHPMTLTTMLDLAIAATKADNSNYAEKLVYQSANRLSKYLATVEELYFSHIATSKSVGKKEGIVLRIENDRDSMFHLHSFVSLFQSQLTRELVSIVGSDNNVVLINHCLFADSVAVLANNYAAAKAAFGLSEAGNSDHGLPYWQLAYEHYRKCFLAFAERNGVGSPTAAKAAYGLARCLREFGETERALEVLVLVISSSQAPDETSSGLCVQDDSSQEESSNPTFLTIRRPVQTKAMNCVAPYKSITTALCLWLMAVLSLDSSPNEMGRERAFRYLHAASVSLQTVLKVDDSGDESGIRETCIQYLAMIEEEAILISDPLYT